MVFISLFLFIYSIQSLGHTMTNFWVPYTRRGDKGVTYIPSYGRIPKHHPLVEVVGTLDEAASSIMLAYSLTPVKCSKEREILEWSARVLMRIIGIAILTGEYRERLDPMEIERVINSITSRVEMPRGFILPGGHPASASAHLARTIIRRLERRMSSLRELVGEKTIPDELLALTNRLSDLLYVVALSINKCTGFHEKILEKSITPPSV